MRALTNARVNSCPAVLVRSLTERFRRAVFDAVDLRGRAVFLVRWRTIADRGNFAYLMTSWSNSRNRKSLEVQVRASLASALKTAWSRVLKGSVGCAPGAFVLCHLGFEVLIGG